MDNPDFLYTLTSRLDNSALELLSHTPFWNTIKEFSDKQDWWYLRVKHLLSADLQPRIGDWKEAYRVLLEAKQSQITWFIRDVLLNPLAVELLIESGLDPSAQDNLAIQDAVHYGGTKAFKILLADSRVNPTVNNNLPIRRASEFGRTEIVKLLLADGRADPTADRNYAIREAASNGEAEVVELLLADGRADPTVNNGYVLEVACRNGHAEVVKLLLADKRVDPTADDNDAIRSAADYQQLEVLQLLLDDGRADPTSNNNAILRYAITTGSTEIVKILLSDPRVVAIIRSDILEPAAVYASTEVIKLLLASGADPSENDNEPLKRAASRGRTEIVKLLLADPRVDPSAADNKTLRHAALEGYTKIVQLLLQDPRVRVSERLLVSAIGSSKLEVVELLVNHRSVTIPEDGGQMLLTIASTSDNGLRAFIVAESRLVDLQSVSKSMLRYLIELIPTYSTSWQECLRFSGGMNPDTILGKLESNNFEQDHYYILLRELLVKPFDIKYYLEWLLEQCERHSELTDYRILLASAAKSYRETGYVTHLSSLFTAYSGFLLLAKTDNAQAILNLLSSEVGVTQEGLQLAGMLIGAYLGNNERQK